jgi:peptidoglycan/LPS O-acetylase OafA/YrhL
VHIGPVQAGIAETIAPARRRIAALDAVRGIAIGFVLLRHGFPGVFGGGGIAGVELFFVLSGFLITGILAGDLRRRGEIRFGHFYRNRALRLVPALVCAVAGVAFIELIFNPLGESSHVDSGVAIGLTYTADFAKLLDFQQLPQLGHLWTLAVEEQFYILWPLVLMGIAAWARGRELRAAWCVMGLAATASIVVLLLARDDLTDAYVLPTTWAVTLLAGCLLALRAVRPPHAAVLGWAAVAGLAAIIFVPDGKDALYTYLGVVPAVAVLATLLIANAAGPQPVALLRSRPLQLLGTISYGAYLWNYPIALYRPGVVSIPLTLMAAAGSYWFVERHFLRLKNRPAKASQAPVPAAEAVSLAGS